MFILIFYFLFCSKKIIIISDLIIFIITYHQRDAAGGVADGEETIWRKQEALGPITDTICREGVDFEWKMNEEKL